MMELQRSFNSASSENKIFVHQLFEDSARRFPDETALIFGTQTFTYKEINDKAESLSNTISRHFSEKIIGVSAARSADTIVAVIAILKAGKAYLPLDTTLPKERLQYLINDACLTKCVAGENEKKIIRIA